MAAETEATAVITDPPTVLPPATPVPASGIRLCGRCRQPSERDPGDPPAGTAAWWLCPPCREALVGSTGRGRPT